MNGGGSRAQLLLCDDNHYYVVKFMGNPQGTRILANEYVVAKIAEFLAAPTPTVQLVEVEDFMVKNLNSSLKPPPAFVSGTQFGSSYLGSSSTQVYPSNPELMRKTANLEGWPAIVVLDSLVQNGDRKNEHVLITLDNQTGKSKLWSVDHGHCLGVAAGWGTLRAENVNLRPLIIR
jgi:hypothetical protein